jgi:hypothetical protein
MGWLERREQELAQAREVGNVAWRRGKENRVARG